MTRNLLLACLFAVAFSGTAWGMSCPSLIAEIDEILHGGEPPTHLEADVLAEAEALRDDGEAYHEAGEHDKAMEALEQALALLGGEGEHD